MMMTLLRNYFANNMLICDCEIFFGGGGGNHKTCKRLEYLHFFTLKLLARQRFLTFISKSETQSLKLRHD